MTYLTSMEMDNRPRVVGNVEFSRALEKLPIDIVRLILNRTELGSKLVRRELDSCVLSAIDGKDSFVYSQFCLAQALLFAQVMSDRGYDTMVHDLGPITDAWQDKYEVVVK
jgi:hypothetical protein